MQATRCSRPTHRGRHQVRLLTSIALFLPMIVPGLNPVSAGVDDLHLDSSGYADVLPEFRDEIAAVTRDEISRYAMDITFDPEASTLTGTLDLAFTNATGEPLDEVYFRLYPNGEHYDTGSLDISDVSVDEQPVVTELSADDTVLRVPLAETLGAKGQVEIEMAFTSTVPTDVYGSYGIFNHVSSTGTWVLADWYPIVAGYEPEPGIGWRLEPPITGVDPTFSDSALYEVTLSAPADWVVVTSGSAISEPAPMNTTADESLVTTYYVAGPARDFTMTLDDDFTVSTVAVGETLVRMYSNPGREAPLEDALDLAVESIEIYSERISPYPFTELDLVDTPLGSGTLGVAWAGIIFLDSASLASSQGDRQFYEFLIAHEVGHQWWGHIVGVNSNDHTFISEGLTNYVMTLFTEWSRGRAAAETMLRTYVAPRYVSLIARSGDQVADVPFQEAPPGHGDVLYGKAALGFLAIRLEIGDEAFFAALTRLASVGDEQGMYAFRIAEPDDFLATFEDVSGQDLAEIWRTWFQVAETTPDDVAKLLDAYADDVAS